MWRSFFQTSRSYGYDYWWLIPCMPNMGSIISSHNHKILKSEKKTVTPSRACNCDKPEDCPLKGHCTGVQCVVYKATISAPNHAEKYYYGLSEPEFKSRYANHKSSLKYPSKRNTTELSKYYWELRDKGVDKIRRTSKLIGVSSDKPINTSVAQGDATCV